MYQCISMFFMFSISGCVSIRNGDLSVMGMIETSQWLELLSLARSSKNFEPQIPFEVVDG